MKCFYHCEEDAVALCVDCGKGLCKECASRFSVPICPECNLRRINADRKLLIQNAAIMIVAFIIGFYVAPGSYSGSGLGLKIFMGYMVAGIPWGWSFLSRITPDIFLFLPLIGWLVYITIKLPIAMFVGFFITPYKIYKTAKELIQARKDEIYTRHI